MGRLNQCRVGALLRRALALKRRKDRFTAHGYAVARGQLHAELNQLLSGTSTDPDNARLAKLLHKHQASVLAFLDHDAMNATHQLSGAGSVAGGDRVEAVGGEPE